MGKINKVMPEDDYLISKYCTDEWMKSVPIIKWEHDYILKQYTILYTQK
jgi:hypothetical protein